MVRFLSLDWGTSTIRLRLIKVPDLTIVGEINSDQGISKTYADWQAADLKKTENRLNFYLKIIQEHLYQLETQLHIPLDGIPLVVSGMASSSIGMLEMPYQPVPFSLDGADLETKFLPATVTFNHPLYLISGVSTENDVMRGEETQLIGFASLATNESQEQLYIFPGTHAKHIWVKKNQATGFKTYMTGEFFSLLTQHSILRASVIQSPDLPEEEATASFVAGVRAAKNANLLQVAFQVRTNDLFGKFSKAQNRHYLSGLLIGLELQDLVQTSVTIYLCGGANLHKPYATALQALQLPQAVHIFSPHLADEAVIRGQYQILSRLIQLT